MIIFSLGVEENSFIESTSNINYYRKEAIHLFGVDDMNTSEIFEYFGNYKPFEVEWINDKSCNVVWKDTYLLALALMELSKPYDDNQNTDKAEQDLNAAEKSEEKSEETDLKNDSNIQIEADNENLKEINLPLGKWRIGVISKKGNQIFMRYAKISDKKVKGAEARSEYYRKYGNPNYGNMKGLISNSKRTKLKSDLIKKFINSEDIHG